MFDVCVYKLHSTLVVSSTFHFNSDSIDAAIMLAFIPSQLTFKTFERKRNCLPFGSNRARPGRQRSHTHTHTLAHHSPPLPSLACHNFGGGTKINGIADNAMKATKSSAFTASIYKCVQRAIRGDRAPLVPCASER